MRPSLPVILLFLFLMLCLAAAYFLTGSLQRTSEARQQQPPDQKMQAVAITLEPRLVTRQSTTRRTL